MKELVFAFMLTLGAGLSTGAGGLAALFIRRDSRKFLSVSLGFSAGVMIYVSMVEILSKARSALSAQIGERPGACLAAAGFFLGIILIAALDWLLPSHAPESSRDQSRLLRTGIFTAIAISIHNFPEGLATFISALQQPGLAIPIAAAIAIHNIPEGIAVAVPVYQATGSRANALRLALLSGLAEPLGALIGYLLLMPLMSDLVFGMTFASVAGIMVFISFDDLLPSAREFGDHHLSIYGLIGGMAVMAISLLLFI